MKILFDNQIFANQNFGGISRYFAEIMSGVRREKIKISPEKFYTNNFHLQQKSLSKLNSFYTSKYFRGKAKLYHALQEYQNRQITSYLKRGNYNVFHPTYYDSKFLDFKPKNKPFVLTVHDMTHEVILDDFHGTKHKETLEKKILIPEANHIIAVSQSTKDNILKLFPQINANKITVIYHGNSLINNTIEPSFTSEENYFLYVGLRNTYKNFKWLLNNIANYLIQNNINLVCAGGGDFTTFENSLIAELNLTKHIQYVQFKSDHYLSSIYRNALGLIIPSLHEGFGIPILEAFACNCPVISNQTSSLPEIGGSAAIYFDTSNPNSLINCLDVVQQETDKLNMINVGIEQLQKFSWKQSVKEHINIYRQFE